jgi:methylated-DNA-[protein]-cysteine S-methyltransferase
VENSVPEIHAQILTPIGPLWMVIAEDRLRALGFGEREGFADVRHPIRDRVVAWFDGELDAIESIVVEPEGSAFQRDVWAALRRVPRGATTTYGDLATSLGLPRHVRAVAGANAKNPIAIVIPCHRVIAKDKTLHGYRYGLERKRWLLAHEQPAFALGYSAP